LKKANHIFTVSNFVKEDIQTKYGINPSKISVIFNGSRHIMTNDLEPINHKIPVSSTYFFYYGAIHPRKNIVNAIKAYNLFRSQNEGQILFLFAGRMAWSTKEIEKAWKESPYAEDIHFLGYLSDASIYHFLKQALALVYISLHEGFGMPIIEAFAAETPVITSNNGALAEISGEGALLVNPLDINDISRGMNEIYANTSLRSHLSEAGKIELNRFNWDNSVQICSRLVTQMAKKGHN
jgi:glycosyltransferase involved in cell wall biosynthesis